METPMKANTSEEDLYGDLDEMFLRQSDGETTQTSEGVILSTSHSGAYTTSQADSEYSKSDTVVDDMNDLDLYDDLIVEEGQQRIESLQEMIKKYEEALTLKNKLEAENQALRELVSKKESATKDMQKNFSSLLITAKGEINRKDRELNSLRRRLSSSPVPALSKYRIPRKSLQDVSSSLESDFDPLYVSSPSRQRPGARTSFNKEFKGIDTPSRLERSTVDSRKKHDADNNDTDRSRVESLDEEEPARTHKYSKIHKGLRSTETYFAEMKGKCDTKNTSQDARSEKSRQNNEQIGEVDVSQKFTDGQQTCRINNDRLRNDSFKEISKRIERRERGESVSEDRKKLSKETNVKIRDDKCEISGTKDLGKDMKKIDLREKLRQKRLEKQSGHNADTVESTVEQDSAENSFMFGSSARDKQNIKLKRIEDKPLCTDHSSLSIFQRKREKKNLNWSKQNEDLSAEKEFLEKLKTTVKKTESSCPYNTKNLTCSDKVTNTVTEGKTQDNSVREIRSYSDINPEMSDPESIINTEIVATNDEYFSATSSESYFSASDYPCNKSTSKTKLLSKDKKTSIEMSENDLSVENGTKKTFVKDLDRMEADSNLTKKNDKQDIHGCEKKIDTENDLEIDNYKHDSPVKNSSILKESEHRRENSQAEKGSFQAYVDRCDQVNTCKEGELIDTESDSKKSQNSSDCNTEMEMRQKCLKKDAENDNLELLRRSARLASKSDSSVSLCKSAVDIRKGEKTKKCVQNENIDNNVSKEEMDMAQKIFIGNTKSVDTRRKKRRIHRSVTSETISSVTLVDMSESFSSVSEEIDDSSQSTENTSTSDDFQSLDKNEKSQKWVCTNRNCTIRMRHLHPKCHEPNLIGEKNKKDSQEVISEGIDSQKDISEGKNADENKKLDSLASNKTDKMEVNDWEFEIPENNSLSSEGKMKSQSIEPELVKDNSMLNVSNGTVELAKAESDSSSSSFSSESELSSEGSRSLSDSSASSESSDESGSETVNQDTPVMAVVADKELVKKSPVPSTKITEMSVTGNKEHCSKPGISVTSNNQKKKSEVENGKGKSSSSLLENTGTFNNKNLNDEGVRCTVKSLLSVPSETKGRNEKEKHSKKQFEVGREEVLHSKEQKTKSMDKINDKSKVENNRGSDICKGTLQSEDKTVNSNDFNNTLSAKDSIQIEVKEAAEPIECYEQDTAKMVKNTNAVGKNASNDGKFALNIDHVDKCNKSSSSGTNTHELSNVIKHIDQVSETVTCGSSDSALQHLKNCDVKDDKETLDKHEISESESEGSFGSNIMSERTGSSLTDDECEYSDSDNSSGSSYTDESSYSSSDESGSGSSWDSSSSYSDSEYDGDAEVKALPEAKSKASGENKQLVSNISCQEKTCVKEARMAGEDFPTTPFNSTNDTEELLTEKSALDKHDFEIAGENQQKDGSVHHDKNEMEVDEETSNACQNQKNYRFENKCLKEKTVLEKNMPEKKGSVAKCSKNVSPKRSNLLQTLLKCVEIDLKGQKPVTEINKDESKIEKFLIPTTKNTDNTKTNEEFLIDKAIVNRSENCFHEKKQTIQKKAISVENVDQVTQTKSSKMLEMDLCDENDRHVSEILQLDVREITKKYKSSKSVSINYEKGKSCNKAEKSHQDTVASSEDVGGCVSKKEYVKSNDKSMSHSGTKKRGQKLNEISQENIFGSTSSLSDTSDSEDSSSWSRSHSSGCSTCLSDSGSATDIESVIPAESEKNCNQKSKTVGLANVKNLKNECEKLNKTEEIDIYINCETAECRGAANEVRSEKSNTLVNNTGCETVSLKPCENNPYWIADEIPEFLSSTENKENQYKKSPSSNSTSSGDTKPLTPAVKFVKLNMSPSQMQAISPDKRFSLSPNTGNDAKSASAVDNHIGVISSVIDKSNLSKRSQQDNDTDPGNKEKSPAPGSSKDCHNHGRTSLAPRNLKETRGGMTKNTNRHKYSDGKNLESELSNQKKENKCNTNSIRSQNLRVKSSKGMNLKSKDVNIEEVKSKKFEKCPLRRSPRKKPSNTSVTDLKAKGKTNEKNEKKQHMTKIQISDSSTSKTGEHNLNVKYVKSAERLNNLKSVGKITVISKSSDDVSKTKERSSKQSSSPCQKEKESKNKQVSSCNENRRKESMKDSKVASKIMECEQAETRKGTPMLLDISEAKDKVSCSKNSSEDKAVSFGKMSVRDTTKILSEKIMKLKVEKNMLEKELKEKQRQEHVQLKMKITLPKTSEVKSGKDAKENMLEGIVLKSGSSRSGKSKPLTVGLAADGSEHLKSKSYNKHTGSLNKYETLTFEEKLTSDVGYLSKSKSADKVSKKNHKQICLIPQTASLKAFTIPKVTKGKQCSSQLKNDKIVTKSRSESSAERNTDKSSECIKEKICNQSTYFKEQKKGDSKSDNTQKKPFSKMYITKNDSESSESNNDNESDSRSSEEDNDALVKAVFGSSDSSGNSGKSLTLDDLCKTRSSEDTDDIVRDNIDADTRNSGDVKEIRGNERPLSKECAEITKLKSKKSHNHSKCFDQPQKIRSGKYTSESKSSDVKSKHSIDVMECSNTDKDHSIGKSTSAKQGQNVRSASTNGEKSLRKSPRIQALESPLKSFPHQNERLDSNYKEAHLKENKRLNRTPQECDQEIMVCQNKNEARYFELSHKNSVLNKIISPKKPNHPSQPENEDILTKKTSNFMSETNESEKPTRKSVPLLLLEECTLDGIDYHDDVIYDSSIGEAAESEESSEEELNNKERSMKKLTDSDSDQSVEDGEVSESDEENVTNKSGQENLKGTSQTCNKMTPRKFKMFSKGRLSPVKFPSNETSCDTDSACKCAKRTCIHKRLGVSDMKQTKRYRSDSDSCSDTSSVRPKRRMKYNHSSTRKQSRSYDKTDNQRNRRQQRFLDNPGRSVSPRNRILSGSKSPQRYRKHSGSRLTSTGRRRRSRSCSRVRSRPVGKDYRTARSRHRYRDEADSCSPRRHQRNRSYSGDTSTSSDRSYCGKNNRSNKNTLETTEKSSNQSNLKKTRSNKNNGSGSENKRIETLQEKCFSGASAANINSSDEENERFSKLKSEKCTGKKNESESVRRAGRNRDHCRRNKSYTLVMRFRSRSRSPSRKRKRYVSGSESETDSNTKRKRNGRQQESKSPRKQRHKRSKNDKYSKDNLHEKKEKS